MNDYDFSKAIYALAAAWVIGGVFIGFLVGLVIGGMIF